jgi:hypothetical protein
MNQLFNGEASDSGIKIFYCSILWIKKGKFRPLKPIQ